MGNKDWSLRKVFLQRERDKGTHIIYHENYPILKWDLLMIRREQKLRERKGLSRTISLARIKRYSYYYFYYYYYYYYYYIFIN